MDDYGMLLDRDYCRPGCDSCLGSCPHDVPIHDILRYSLYFNNYGSEKHALERYASLPPGRTATNCAACDAPCISSCPFGIAIKDKLEYRPPELNVMGFDNALHEGARRCGDDPDFHTLRRELAQPLHHIHGWMEAVGQVAAMAKDIVFGGESQAASIQPMFDRLANALPVDHTMEENAQRFQPEWAALSFLSSLSTQQRAQRVFQDQRFVEIE